MTFILWCIRLVEQGYDEIVVAGLSLGGDFALKLSLNRDVKGIVIAT
jgi:carboxylesterase